MSLAWPTDRPGEPWSLTMTAAYVLAWWRAHFIDARDVVAWADARLAGSADPPSWLCDLSMKGPARYLDERSRDEPIALVLTPTERLSGRIEAVDEDDRASLEAFMHWLFKEYMGRYHEDPIAPRVYAIDYVFEDLGDLLLALSLTRDLLHEYAPQACTIATTLGVARLRALR